MTGSDTEEREEGEIVTPDKPKAEAVHPLENVWTLWFNSSSGQTQANDENWGDHLKPIYNFSTVEQFWAMFNNLMPPSSLKVKMDMYVFKKGIEPKWEDHKCAKGGRWTAPLPKDNNGLNKAWLEVLLAMIGEQFREGDDICGIVLQPRKGGCRVSLWTKTGRDEAMQLSLGRKLKEILSVSDRDKLIFKLHEDELNHRRIDKYSL